MIATDTNLKRLLQQMQSAAASGLADPTQAFGLAVAFLTTVFTATTQVVADNRAFSAALESAHQAIIAAAVTRGDLAITLSTVHGAETQDGAHSRHLRNCFAHCNWKYDEAAVTATHMPVHLEDYNKGGTQTFSADIQLPALVNLAEELLLATWKSIP